MTTKLYSELSWLPKPLDDFYQRCSSLLVSNDPVGERIRSLASHALDLNQLDQLAVVISELRESGRSLAPLMPFKLGLVSNANVDFFGSALSATAARHGIGLECTSSNFDQVIQAVLDQESLIYKNSPDAILVAIDHRGLPLRSGFGNQMEADTIVRQVAEYLQTIRAGIKKNSDAVCMFQTVAAPPELVFGNIERSIAGTVRNIVDEVNRVVVETVRGTGDILLDVANIAETVGLAEWHCPRQWNLARLPFSDSYLPLYADHVARVIAAVKGKSRRCLVLDLDNTLWGGVIGDDGIEGIKIAQGDSTGEAYLSLQRYARALRERGVVLAVSSKNEDTAARLPFRQHPEMVLREADIAVFQANWNDKASNIKAISEELSLGLDSMVFLDDNPVERGLVRRLLPQVAVPELPDDPALFTRTLAAAGYFESAFFSAEDAQRSDFYQGNARRVVLQKQAGDLEAYLASLAMEITFRAFDATGRGRITQLINKSNQFNLTTRRYTESEIGAIEQEPDCYTLQVRLADCFGDNGMISVVICRQKVPAEWEIEVWLMSCRVLGRRVENAVLQEILVSAHEKGIRRLVGRYIPSGRNALVADHYKKLGFVQLGEEPDGTTVWCMEVGASFTEEHLFKVKRVGFDRSVVQG